MKLLTADLKKKFLITGSQQKVKDPVIIARYFIPIANWDFYATEFNHKTNIFVGIFKWLETEWGTLSLYDLENLREPGGAKVERLIGFKPCRMGELGLTITSGW